MTAHGLYVTAAYGLSGLGIAGLIGWIMLDRHWRRLELQDLETNGIRRRSDAAGQVDGG